MDVCDARATPAAIVRVISYGEEPHAGFQVPIFCNLAVEVVDYGNRQGG